MTLREELNDLTDWLYPRGTGLNDQVREKLTKLVEDTIHTTCDAFVMRMVQQESANPDTLKPLVLDWDQDK